MKKFVSLLLTFVIVVSVFAIVPFSAGASTSLPNSIYITQATTGSYGTCTLASVTMMLRSRAYLSGHSNWSSITESAVKSVAWGSSLKWSFTYTATGISISVARNPVSGISISSLKSLLNSHPEGIMLYCGNMPHAVFVTDYEGDTFYCADPDPGYSGSRRTLASSALGKKYGSQSSVLSNATAYWYVSSYNITGHTTHSYDTYVYYWASHPHYKCYKCSCGEVKENTNEKVLIGTCSHCLSEYRATLSTEKSLYLQGETVTINWNKVPNATHYNLWLYKSNDDGTNQLISRNDLLTDTTFSFSDLAVGKYYTVFNTYNKNFWELDHSDWFHSGSDRLEFQVIDPENLGEEFYATITRTWDGMAVTDDNRNLALYTNTNSDNQLWRFTRQSDGSYMIYNVASRGYIDLAHSSATNHTNVQVIIKHDVNAQHWYIFKTDVGYSLATKCGVDWRLDVADNGTAEGTNVQVYKFHNHAAQKFYINKVDRITFNTNETEEDILVFPINNVNGVRGNGYNVIYTNELGTKTNTNIYGVEKSFDPNGKLVETRDYGVETKLQIPTYGFVLSMHASSANYGEARSEEYQYAYYDSENNNIELFKNESDYQQRRLEHLIGSKSFFKEDVYVVQATNIDEPREAKATVIYTSNFGANTATNQYGYEVSFDSEGKLVATREWDNTAPLEIPSRGFVVSEHSSSSVYQTVLSENYQYGYCNFEQKVVVLFKNKEDYEMGKRLFCAQKQSYGELPVPVREGFTFDGWYTQPDGGEKVDSATLYTGAKELYAHWTPNTTTILGDVDGDKKVSIMDATEIQRHIAQLSTIPEDRLPYADTDRDTRISIMDATQIQRFIAQLIPKL